MSSSALERLSDQSQHYQRSSPAYNYNAHNPYQDNYGQYAEIGHSSGTYRPGLGLELDSSTDANHHGLEPYYGQRPSPSTGAAVLPTVVRPPAAADGYGHMGIPDPRAPAFVPGSGYI
jgi:hypothetical protein